MKKLIITAAIVCAAAMSQAASYQWKATNMEGYDGNVLDYAVTMYVYSSDGSTLWSSASVSDGNILASADTTFSSDDFTVGTVYKFYLTYQDAEGNTFKSALKGGKASQSSSPTLSFTPASGTWTPAPEPTSAILMLLGMAGLALKRKRA